MLSTNGRKDGLVSRVLVALSQWLYSELDDGSVKQRNEAVERRLRILVSNLAVPVAAGVVASLLQAPAIAIMAVFMMLVGLVATRSLPTRRTQQVTSCRHFIWGMLFGAGFFRLMTSWSTTKAPYGLPSLLGPHTSSIVTMMGTEIMPALLYTTLTMIPLFYLRAVYEDYKSVQSKGDTARDIAMVGRYRKARKY